MTRGYIIRPDLQSILSPPGDLRGHPAKTATVPKAAKIRKPLIKILTIR